MPEIIADGILWLYLMLYLILAGLILFHIARYAIDAARGFHDRRYRFSLRTLLLAMTLLTLALGLLTYANSRNRRVHDQTGDAQPTADVTVERLNEEFTAINPAALEGWTIVQPGPDQRWFAWSKHGIAYFDRNADGLPDMKYRQEPRLSTTEVWWEDTNYDGMFDTEVEEGCFHYVTRPLGKLIAVPSVPATTTTKASGD